MFGSNSRQYNNNNNVNVNTRLFTSYSDAAMIVMGAWNTNLSLKVHPFKGMDADGTRQYAQDKTEIVNTSITNDNAHALIEAIDKVFQPAVDEKRAESIGILIGSGENRKSLSLKTDGTDIFLELAVGVNEQGVPALPENIITHKFNKRHYTVSFDPRTGEGTTVEANTDYDEFVAVVRAIDDLMPVTAHSINYNNQVRSSYGSKNMNQQNFGNNGGYQAPVQNYGASSDMSEFLPVS